MSKKYSVAIVGGGASGLICAAKLVSGENALRGDEVVILEKNDRVGKKLVATGNGRGNLFNTKFGEEYYHGDEKFIRDFAENFRKLNPPAFIEELGVPLAEEEGKIYPASFQANAVTDILRSFLAFKRVEEKTASEVTEIYREKGGFLLKTVGGEIFAEKAVLAFGGAASGQFGTEGKSFALAKRIGHTVTDLQPSLVQLKTELTHIKGLKGLKENVRIKAVCEGKIVGESDGEILFTDYGVSGNAVFAVSSRVTDKKEVTLDIEFAPRFTREKLYDLFAYRSRTNYINYNELLLGIVNKKIGEAIVKRSCAKELFEDEKTRSVALNKIINLVKRFRLKVTGNLGLDYAQVTKGGVKTSEINPQTYESKKTLGIYIIGEALDVDGDCGGYNLSFAFCTGMAAAEDIKDKLCR